MGSSACEPAASAVEARATAEDAMQHVSRRVDEPVTVRGQHPANGEPAPGTTGPAAPSTSRSPTRAQLRTVHERDESRCTYRAADGRRCRETGWLEAHHTRAVARGGKTEPEALRVLCRAHHDLQTRLDFGAENIDAAIERRRGRRGRP